MGGMANERSRGKRNDMGLRKAKAVCLSIISGTGVK